MDAVALKARRAHGDRSTLKRIITRSLGQAGFIRATVTNDGFDYSDERGEHSFAARDARDPSRIGLNLTWRSNALWGGGDYAEANVDQQARQYEMAAALVRAGWKLTVEQNHANDPGHIVIWADENGVS